MNHKRVMRIMGEDNLLAVRMRAFVVTTNSQHEFEVHLNLAGRMKLTGINQRGSGHHRHPIEVGICVLGGDSRCLFPESGRVGVGQDVSGAFSTGSAQQSSGREEPRARPGAPFRSRLQYASSEYETCSGSSR